VSDADPKLSAKIADETASVFESEINKFYKLNNVRILDKAEVSKSAYNVNYIKDNVIYLLIGFIISCGAIFIVFYFDTTIKTSDEVEQKLGLTVMGIVPKVGKE
jgi:capsular polysaccharide biosynthesis protein